MLNAFAIAALALPQALVAPEPAVTDIPSGWSVIGESPKDARIELNFAVKQRNLQSLHDTLLSVSDPKSPSYGEHLSNEAVHALIKPSDEDIATVHSFINTVAGVEPRAASPNSDFITAVMTIGQAEALLGAKYEVLRHGRAGVQVHRASRSGYRLPESVAAAVDFVSPTVHVPGVRTAKKDQLSPLDEVVESPNVPQHNVPETLRQLYSIGFATVGNATSNRMAVTAFLGQMYSEEALKEYWAEYCSEQKLTCGKGLPTLVGDATTGTPGVESMLDIETITGVAGNVHAEFWGFAGRSPDNPENEPFMKWLTQMASTPDETVPLIFSTSYGEDEASWSYAAADRLNVEFAKAGTRGISLLYASGDEGANCEKGKYVPETPSSSPYVTAVGGTGPTTGYPKPGFEEGIGLSSGGFSNYWPMPEWQRGAVTKYLATAEHLPEKSVGYNTSGRAYPDIAAQATGFCVTPFGCGVAGTSCASPTAAGVFALLNDVRLSAGKPPLGFLNPFIYQAAAAFNDITVGNSGGGCGIGIGWPTAKAWDAVTGVGTPNFELLKAAVVQLP
jgi:tripeptidyl-peptidase-1